jgi:hypothetical protein
MNIKIIMLVLITTLLSGCGSAYQVVNLQDHVLLPSARISRRIASIDRNADPSEVQSGLTAELGASSISGGDTIAIVGTSRLGEVTFAAPQDIDTEFDLKTIDASIRWRQFYGGESLGFDVFTGFGYADLVVKAASPTAQVEETLSSPTLRVGLGGFWRIVPSTSLEATATFLATNRSFDHISGYDIKVVRTLGPHAAIHGGYSTWQLQSIGRNRSTIDLKFSGPAMGVDVKF